MTRLLPALLLLAACGGKDDTAGPTRLCDGSGAAAVEIDAWNSDPSATLTEVAGSWGLDFTLQVDGLATDDPWTSVLRFAWEGPGTSTEDYLASLQAICDEEDGIQPFGLRIELPTELQADAASLARPDLPVTATVSDANGKVASAEWSVDLSI